VITLALVLGYLWKNGQLSNEKVFRVLAVMQDIDLQQMAAAEKETPEKVPPQEPSLNEVMHHQHVQDRNYEVKMLALQRGRSAYDAKLQELNLTIARYDRTATDWQRRLKEEQERTAQENVGKVVSQLEQVSPEVGKEQLKKWIEDQKMDDAIILMSKMSESKLAKILKTFESEDELKQLHEIHKRIIAKGVANSTLEQALGELDAISGSK
jgi:hypothetical protein